MKASALFTAICLFVTSLVVTAAAAQESYLVRPGDTLRIEVIEDPSLSRSVLVAPDGRISIPLADSVQAAGLSIQQIQAELTRQLAANFASPPNVFVAVESLYQPRIVPPSPVAPPAPPPVIDIFVLGEVGAPGKIEVSPDTNLLQLFAQMGGFTRFAATRRIQLRRTDAAGTETVYVVNYDAILAGTTSIGQTRLVEGDVIVVPARRLFE